jgi:hypothetical protein
MDFKAGIGSLNCRLCAASYQMPVHHLHEPVDVFSEWLDDCEAAAQGKATGDDQQPDQYEDESEEEEDDLPEASGLQSKPAAAKASNDNTTARPSYTDLGLEDSDSDDD